MSSLLDSGFTPSVSYARRSRAALSVYSKFIYAWYDPAFRAVFLRPRHGAPGVGLLTREIISVLAGAVLPPWRALPAMQVLLGIAWPSAFTLAAILALPAVVILLASIWAPGLLLGFKTRTYSIAAVFLSPLSWLVETVVLF